MKQYTHICIETPKGIWPSNVKKGDYLTCTKEKEGICGGNISPSGVWFFFEEDQTTAYCSGCFLPLPPQQEKTLYVSVSETIKEFAPEEILN
jgi:hypothetical protein